MSKRALCVVAAVVTIATLTVSPVSASVAPTPAPHTRAAALKVLRADVMNIARNFSHKRYRGVCFDLSTSARTHLGGMTTCTYKVALLHLLVPIKKFTITATKLSNHRSQASVTLYVNGNRTHREHIVAKWQRGAYRLDHQSGWMPTL